ncbi:hypothetical protein IAU59_007621 [Kwoniella sp. CBS 9459]
MVLDKEEFERKVAQLDELSLNSKRLLSPTGRYQPSELSWHRINVLFWTSQLYKLCDSKGLPPDDERPENWKQVWCGVGVQAIDGKPSLIVPRSLWPGILPHSTPQAITDNIGPSSSAKRPPSAEGKPFQVNELTLAADDNYRACHRALQKIAGIDINTAYNACPIWRQTYEVMKQVQQDEQWVHAPSEELYADIEVRRIQDEKLQNWPESSDEEVSNIGNCTSNTDHYASHSYSTEQHHALDFTDLYEHDPFDYTSTYEAPAISDMPETPANPTNDDADRNSDLILDTKISPNPTPCPQPDRMLLRALSLPPPAVPHQSTPTAPKKGVTIRYQTMSPIPFKPLPLASSTKANESSSTSAVTNPFLSSCPNNKHRGKSDDRRGQARQLHGLDRCLACQKTDAECIIPAKPNTGRRPTACTSCKTRKRRCLWPELATTQKNDGRKDKGPKSSATTSGESANKGARKRGGTSHVNETHGKTGGAENEGDEGSDDSDTDSSFERQVEAAQEGGSSD